MSLPPPPPAPRPAVRRPVHRGVWVGATILAGADDGKVYALFSKDGVVAWSQDFDGPVTSLTYAGGEGDELYVGTTDGVVFATRLVP